MKVLITGANGFIGKNLRLHLAEREDVSIVCFTREDDPARLKALLGEVDFVFHLAGVNRPEDPAEFVAGNVDLTMALCQALRAEMDSRGRRVPVIYTSSTQARQDNPYGRSKRGAEELLQAVAQSHQIPVHVFRLPNVFGKWCMPNYNSAVATFCHNISRGLSIQVNDQAAPVTLVYVDDVIERFVQIMDGADAQRDTEGFSQVTPQYTVTVGELARQIQVFRDSRSTLTIDRVGSGFLRALYATYVSYLLPESFAYEVPSHGDARGVFVEMLKTPDCGQFSFFTAHPGITRGGHYHHTKTEKFLVIKGRACFKFRHMQTGEMHELVTSGERPEIVETVPGWTHDVTNIGTDEMVVMLWANEVFDRAHPDTFACPV
ncbi:capsular polysaccharide biosynthesis protein CapF [Cupriavidus sp. WS]|uniref:UDP-2-acetamido-2,6-beta-L-arabino-hexul-4-ose reductase n=1 Tax=Cupriavidus sp. WS TaxID=1312922 RepID=UPI00036A48C1|nr:capsular polysaccharide biosynthesis protein CapF [Cupriavidus sp. WS]